MRDKLKDDDITPIIIFDYEQYDVLQEIFKEHHIWTNEEIHYKLHHWFTYAPTQYVNQKQLISMKKKVKAK